MQNDNASNVQIASWSSEVDQYVISPDLLPFFAEYFMLKSNGDWNPKSDHVLHLGRFVYPLVALLAYVLTITPRLHDDGIRTNEERCA